MIQAVYHIKKETIFKLEIDLFFPFIFILIDAIVILIAVLRVYRILREESQLSLNEMYIGLHVVLLFVLAAVSLAVYLLRTSDMGSTLWVWFIYQFIDFAVSCLIAFIMW